MGIVFSGCVQAQGSQAADRDIGSLNSPLAPDWECECLLKDFPRSGVRKKKRGVGFESYRG